MNSRHWREFLSAGIWGESPKGGLKIGVNTAGKRPNKMRDLFPQDGGGTEYTMI